MLNYFVVRVINRKATPNKLDSQGGATPPPFSPLTPTNIMQIHLINLGCKVNYTDLSHIQSLLIQNNHLITSTPQNADAIIINTCAVTNQAEAQSRQTIRKIRRSAPDCYIIVTGCYAQISADDIIQQTGADAVIGTKDKFKIPEDRKE